MKPLTFFLTALALIIPSMVFAQNEFYALTDIPQFEQIAQSNNFTDLVNLLYRICIGVGAAIAVGQIIRAGVMWAGGESFKNVSKARELIQQAILGLILLLAPYIILTIIDPRITQLHFDTTSLQHSETPGDVDENGSWTDEGGVVHQNVFNPDSSLPNCVINGSSFSPVADGASFSLPEGAGIAQCCENQGYNVVSEGILPSSRVCLSDESLAERDAATEDDAPASQTGENTYNISWNINTFGYIFTKIDTVSGNSCSRALFKTNFENQAACVAEKTQYQTQLQTYNPLYDCTKNETASAQVEITLPHSICQ